MPVAEKVIRNKKIYKIWKRGKEGKVKNPKGYKKIAKEVGLDYTTVGRIIRRYKNKEKNKGR